MRGVASNGGNSPTVGFYEELRIASVDDTRFKWLAGCFYSDFESGWDIIFPSQTGAQVFGVSNSLFDYYSP